jgi:hypothetical protein
VALRKINSRLAIGARWFDCSDGPAAFEIDCPTRKCHLDLCNLGGRERAAGSS